MQRHNRPALLYENNYGTKYPAPVSKTLDVSSLNGGLNLWELDYKLDVNQSPDLLNVFWKDGSLSSRPGQAYVYNTTTDTEHSYGNFHACYDKLWQSNIIAHKGTNLYKINPTTGEHTAIFPSGDLAETNVGRFFVFGDKLYYMDGEDYIVINASSSASRVDPYVPIVIINRKPDGTGGSTFQDENRLTAKKRIQFTADGSSVNFVCPTSYTPIDSTLAVTAKLSSPSVINYIELQAYSSISAFPATGLADVLYKANDTSKYYKWTSGAYVEETTTPTLSNTFTVNRTTGTLTFNTAPAASTITPSNLEVRISKTTQKTDDARYSILRSMCTTVYGGDKQLAVICGGPPGQPNAYFWSGSTTAGLDPTYFPFDYYNYAGANAQEYITGFGKQQSMLVIFKERSIGKTTFEVKHEDENDSTSREYLKLSYKPVNDSIGCDLGKSIRLVQNNLVFANTYGGVYVLLDTTAYGENTVKRLSRNVNGDTTTKGLLYDLIHGSATGITSYDDQQRYWITANGKAYLWDYTLSPIGKAEGKMSWFLFDTINSLGWNNEMEDKVYFTQNGSIVKFVELFNDFGAPISRKYTFATQNFGTYEVLKDVLKVVFAVRSDTDSAMTITYKTDYEIREDLTPIRSYGYRLVPRDLTHRSLKPMHFAGTAVRTPRCFHIRHFQMTITNNTMNTDMSVISAQIIYRYNREDR